MSSFLMSDRHGYSVKFSPFEANRLVVASSQLYGLAGGGTLYDLRIGADETIEEINQFQWQDGLFDVVWSRKYPYIVATSSGDGTIQLWNLYLRGKTTKPIVCLQEHTNEVYSIDWSKTSTSDQILSGSWDGSTKLWDPTRKTSIATFFGHTDLIYSSSFSEHIPNVFSSVSIDGSLNLWNSLDISGKPVAAIQAHSGEVLTCDWSRLDSNLLATGASDGLIRGWDIRQLSKAVFELDGCEYAVRRIRFSPHLATVIASANYDFSTRIWDFEKNSEEALEVITNHSEFVCGVDWSNHVENQIADCGWDSFVNVFVPSSLNKCALH